MEISYEMVQKKAAAYCSHQEVCPADMLKKMENWGVDMQLAAKAVSYLINEKYIDNERYCRSFVNDKFRFNKWGKVKIAQALRAKQIPDDVAERVLSEMDVSLYEEMLAGLLQKKAREVKASNDYERKGKLLNFALQRGFEYPVADRLIKTLKL